MWGGYCVVWHDVVLRHVWHGVVLWHVWRGVVLWHVCEGLYVVLYGLAGYDQQLCGVLHYVFGMVCCGVLRCATRYGMVGNYCTVSFGVHAVVVWFGRWVGIRKEVFSMRQWGKGSSRTCIAFIGVGLSWG